ncbi:MAG: 5'-nucleotidase, lipoprotein e(P4) family [Thermoanaerobaculia bacterium]
MHRTLLAVFTLTIVACTTTTPAPAPVAQQTQAQPTATTPQCNPGHQLVNAVLWVDTSAEYRAAALSTYAAARRSLDAALADPQWIGTPEDSATNPPQPPAIILDLDETALDNIEYEARAIRANTTYDGALWKQWVDEGNAKAVPGAAEFLAYAKSRGVTPFYITNRDWPQEEEGTRKNLERLGFPLDASVDTLLMRGKGEFKGSDKGPRRAFVAQSYRVLLLLGDDLNDFANARDKSAAERDAIVNTTQDWWGVRWFILPNPMYGSFERAAIGSGGTPCEQLQRKIDALSK